MKSPEEHNREVKDKVLEEAGLSRKKKDDPASKRINHNRKNRKGNK